jgi:hypothetical protein
MKAAVFWIITATALVVSGNATYEVLTGTVGIQTYIALAAAVVIDAAAIWMGWHTTTLAKLGDSTRAAQLATWFIISISLVVNFYHGYVEGSWAGGLVGLIFPLLAALLYDFYIRHTIREELRSRGLILPEKPNFIKSRKYGDKSREEKINRDYVSLTYDLAEDNLAAKRYNLKTEEIHVSQALELVSPAQITSDTTEETDDTDLSSQVEAVFADVTDEDNLVSLPDYLSPGMNTSQICRLLVSHGVRDIDTAERYINIINEDTVSRATVRQTLLREIKKYEGANA